jgi:hypothetical protein
MLKININKVLTNKMKKMSYSKINIANIRKMKVKASF